MMLNRTPWSASKRPVVVSKKRPDVPWKLSKAKHLELIRLLTPHMRKAEPTAFAMEAPQRYGLRSSLCLDGWPWCYADQEAAAVVHAALHRVGARRPLWIEGQQEYTSGGFLRDEHCWVCGSPLPRHAKKFCCERHARIGKQIRVTSMYDLIIM